MSKVKKLLTVKRDRAFSLTSAPTSELPAIPELSENVISSEIDTQMSLSADPEFIIDSSNPQNVVAVRGGDYMPFYSSFVGTGEGNDILLNRLKNIYLLTSSYLEYFKALLKVEESLQKASSRSKNLPQAQFNLENLFMPLGSKGFQDINNDFSDLISTTLSAIGEKKRAVLSKAIASLSNINSDLSKFSKSYTDKIHPIYTSLMKERKQIDELSKSLVINIQSAEFPKDVKRIQDPFLINFELKKIISQTVQTEKSLHKSVQIQVNNYVSWEPYVLHRIFSVILDYFQSENRSSNQLSQKYNELCESIVVANSKSETQEFINKFGRYFDSPQGCDGLATEKKYFTDSMSNKSLKIIKKGHLVRKSKSLSHFFSANKKFIKTFVILTASGFMHCFDESHDIPTATPDFSFHLASTVVKDGDNYNLPRNAIVLYVTRGWVKGSPITSKTKVSFKAESYEQGIEWSRYISNWSNSTIEDIFSEELGAVPEEPVDHERAFEDRFPSLATDNDNISSVFDNYQSSNLDVPPKSPSLADHLKNKSFFSSHPSEPNSSNDEIKSRPIRPVTIKPQTNKPPKATPQFTSPLAIEAPIVFSSAVPTAGPNGFYYQTPFPVPFNPGNGPNHQGMMSPPYFAPNNIAQNQAEYNQQALPPILQAPLNIPMFLQPQNIPNFGSDPQIGSSSLPQLQHQTEPIVQNISSNQTARENTPTHDNPPTHENNSTHENSSTSENAPTPENGPSSENDPSSQDTLPVFQQSNFSDDIRDEVLKASALDHNTEEPVANSSNDTIKKDSATSTDTISTPESSNISLAKLDLDASHTSELLDAVSSKIESKNINSSPRILTTSPSHSPEALSPITELNETSKSIDADCTSSGNIADLIGDLDKSILPPGMTFGTPINSLPPGAKIFHTESSN
ncbi:hypothetical protein AYI68_g2920 [Smittium mucronatum]|uniref:PH domain-containing protein n=1 Tax=Smittium mucronatum TaxID=133383 RepID=A0A1R0H1D7_9FUNG|nr:hypothetical protein AYI68_g2920 [Smittium mucronatum]